MTGALLEAAGYEGEQFSASEHAARWFEPRHRKYATPLDLAYELDRKTRRSQALDLINAALVDLTDGNEYDALDVEMPPQEGKLVGHNEPVPTPHGWRQHGDLRPGDYVLSPSGKPVRVLAVSPDSQATMRVRTSDHGSVICHERHEWAVYDRARSQWRTMETADLARRMLHAGPAGRHGGRWIFQLPARASLELPDADLPIDPYTLGVWLGDGSSSKAAITHHSDDKYQIAYPESARCVHAVTGIVTTYYRGGMAADLKAAGLWRNKHIPAAYLRGSEKQRRALLAGLIDTDGHVSASGQVSFDNTDEQLVRAAAELIRTLGYRAHVHRPTPAKLSSSGIQGKLAMWRVTYTPHDEGPARLARKTAAKLGIRRRIAITAIERVPPEPGRCITVDSPDGLYLVGEQFTPTHNSQLTSRRYPEWALEYDQALRIAVVSYEQELAMRWGRDIKQDIRLAQDRLPISIRQDSAAAGRWETVQGGGVYCVGIGGPLTGKPVDILIIDDPVKDRAAAESDKVRENTWAWYESVALTRLAPGGKVVLIQCMTGDTPVLMGDGTEKPLRDVRPGDTVATYEDGGVTTATVRNWAKQGPDFVYRLRMKSGRVVAANARHPFLTIQDGVETWQRTDQLRPGSIIQTVTGGSGGGSPAPAVSPRGSQAAPMRDCACPATTSSGGLTGTGRRQSTRNPGGPRTSSTATASVRPIMTGYSRSRAASAPSASAPTANLPTGTRHSASITVTTPCMSGACSATTATPSSATPQQSQSCGPLATTCAIEADEVAEITPCGTEDVYDLQIDRTENFIANGLVAHNTRWHQDDLAGRIASRPSPLRWRRIVIPAIATGKADPLGRAKGTELVSVRGRAPGHFRNLRANTGAYSFSSIYQQDPTAAEGNMFRRAAFRYWRPADPWSDGRERISCEGRLITMADCWYFHTMDFAASTRTEADWTVCSTWAVTVEGDLVLLERARGQVAMHEHFTLAEPAVRKYGGVVYAERQFYSKTFVTDARDAGIPVAELQADTDKVTRAIPATGRVHSGKVWFPAEVPWVDEWADELAGFPMAANDDQVDTLAYAALVMTQQWTPSPAPARNAPTPHERAVQQAYQSALGASGNGHSSTGGGELDIMNVPY